MKSVANYSVLTIEYAYKTQNCLLPKAITSELSSTDKFWLHHCSKIVNLRKLQEKKIEKMFMGW